MDSHCYRNLVESYSPSVTMSYPDWVDYVSTGSNVFFGDAVYPSKTLGGAVYAGHVRQNPMTASFCNDPACWVDPTIATSLPPEEEDKI